MGRSDYVAHLTDNLRNLGFRIDALKAKLMGATDDRRKVDLCGEIEHLERRRDELAEKLRALRTQPESTWADFKAGFQEEWDALVQDFEERVGRLA